MDLDVNITVRRALDLGYRTTEVTQHITIGRNAYRNMQRNGIGIEQVLNQLPASLEEVTLENVSVSLPSGELRIAYFGREMESGSGGC